MKKIKSNCFEVLPNRGTQLIVNVPGYALEVDGLVLAVCKLFGKWGVYDPVSGMSGHRTFTTKAEAVEFAVECLADPVALKRAKENAGTFSKAAAARQAGSFVAYSTL
jgi:hypothetical protein